MTLWYDFLIENTVVEKNKICNIWHCLFQDELNASVKKWGIGVSKVEL